MKRRHRSSVERVDQQMTPMIDIVFQLLTFFVMSFKIATQEGDFDVNMPIGVSHSGPMAQPVKVRLVADRDGALGEIRVGEKELGTDFGALQREIAAVAGADLEVEFDCDYELHYNNVMNAITAVTGKLEGERRIIYVDKIKFSPPRMPRG